MTRPNVLWIVSDHQVFANRGVDPDMFPMQAWLRERGTEFSRAYTVLPICSPSRASMLTGLYPHTHGLTENDGRFGGRAELDAGDRMIQHEFADRGYTCGWFGKWHLSQDGSALDFGFEGFSLPGYGYPYGTAEYRHYLSGFHDGPLWAKVELTGESRREPGTSINLTAEDHWFDYEAGTAFLEGTEAVHEAFFLADAATKWIGDLPHDRPFFVRLDAWGPHPPYMIPTGFSSPLQGVDITPNGNLAHDLGTRPRHHRDYRDQWRKDLLEDAFNWPLLSRRAAEHCIIVERAFIKVVEQLEAMGRLEDTIIVFCADHGDAVASNGGVMNKGGLLVEETLRIPLLFAGPGIAKGSTTNSLIGNIDIAPTLLDMCGLTTTIPMQGRSAAAHLAAPEAVPFRSELMVEHYGLHVPILQRAFYKSNWKYVIQPDGFEEIYDLSTDPCEIENLAGTKAMTNLLADLRSGLQDEMHRLEDTDPRLARIKQVLAGGAPALK